MQLKDMMSTKVITVRPETTIAEIARLLIENSISGLPVVDEEMRPVGIVSESDLLRHQVEKEQADLWDSYAMMMSAGIAPELQGAMLESAGISAEKQKSIQKVRARTASELMTSPAVSMEESEDITRAAKLMLDRRIKRLPVTRDGKLTGIVSRHSFVRLAVESGI